MSCVLNKKTDGVCLKEVIHTINQYREVNQLPFSIRSRTQEMFHKEIIYIYDLHDSI